MTTTIPKVTPRVLSKRARRYMMVKDILDRLLALILLLLLWWLLAIVALVVILDDGRPAIFTQERVGQHGKTFRIYKFRTMKRSAPKSQPTHLLGDPRQYLTRSGAFLRRSSLDELPQLVNILLGQMSFVGPRPVVPNQGDLLALRHENMAEQVRPGLTGWAQINGRDEVTEEEKAWLDGEYVAHMGFWMDIRCFFGTVLPVLRQQGVAEGKRKEKQASGRHDPTKRP